jgi:hypothetical protein
MFVFLPSLPGMQIVSVLQQITSHHLWDGWQCGIFFYIYLVNGMFTEKKKIHKMRFCLQLNVLNVSQNKKNSAIYTYYHEFTQVHAYSAKLFLYKCNQTLFFERF